MAVNTQQPLENKTDGYLCKGSDVKGSYFVVSTIAERDNLQVSGVGGKDGSIVDGSLCYCQANDKFYIYKKKDENNNGEWIEKKILNEQNFFLYNIASGGLNVNEYIGDLEEVILPNYWHNIRIDTLNDGLFMEKTIKKIEINAEISQISTDICNNCVNLTNFTCKSNKLEIIRNNAFKNCSLLEELRFVGNSEYFPSSLKAIGAYAFYGCSNLCKNIEDKELYLSNCPSDLIIGDEAFSGCTSIEYISLPRDYTGESLGKGAFKNCSNLAYIQTANANPLSRIPDNCFHNCENLKYVNIKHNNYSGYIGANAFRNTSLTNKKGQNGDPIPFELGGNIDSYIGDRAFSRYRYRIY